MKLIEIPKHSYHNGFTDEGISDVLKKPSGFRYSELFLSRWYEDDKSKVKGDKRVKK